MDNQITNPAITKEVVEQFEKVRQSGKSNMLDKNGVLLAAAEMDLWDLWEFLVDDITDGTSFYKQLIVNNRQYYEEYGVKHG